jgi:hypothetical protein
MASRSSSPSSSSDSELDDEYDADERDEDESGSSDYDDEQGDYEEDGGVQEGEEGEEDEEEQEDPEAGISSPPPPYRAEPAGQTIARTSGPPLPIDKRNPQLEMREWQERRREVEVFEVLDAVRGQVRE